MTVTRTFEEIIAWIGDQNPSAATFLRLILDICATWDDLIDRDEALSDEQINRAFKLALVDLPRNRFYSENFDLLNPIIIVAIHNWHLANRIERTQDTEMLQVSFIIRSSYVDLFTMTGFIIGGSGLAGKIGEEARRFVHDEGFLGYEQALSEERAKRGD